MQRLGIFGGTFNPPHIGHTYIAGEAVRGANLDKMLFIPCGTPPHKEVEGLLDAKHRFEMTRLAIKNYPDFEITDLEISSGGVSYTAKTLEKLKLFYPDTELCFVVGGDSLRDMEKWYCPQKIFELAEIVALSRGGIENEVFADKARLYTREYGARITVVNVDPIDISSSEIRKMIANGMDVSKFVDKDVLNYIQKIGIYREND